LKKISYAPPICRSMFARGAKNAFPSAPDHCDEIRRLESRQVLRHNM